MTQHTPEPGSEIKPDNFDSAQSKADPESARQTNAEAMASLARALEAKAVSVRKDDGQIDLLATAGGIRGIAESILPGLVFLIMFTLNKQLAPALIGSVVIAGIFLAARLIQRTPLTQSLAGILGVGLSAFIAMKTGKAQNYYVFGFYTNAAYIAAMIVSIAAKWPVLGLLFGYARNEGVRWRQDPDRLRAYGVATWVIVAIMAVRLAVQLPLYFANNVDALGAMRLLMGVPLYALGLWVAWLISRPAAAAEAKN